MGVLLGACAFMYASDWVRGNDDYDSEVDGDDRADVGDCAVGALYDRAGIVNTGSYTTGSGGSVGGSPPHQDFGSFEAISDSAGVRWDVLSSPAFPIVNDDGDFPDYLAIPADSFPVVRVTSDLTASISHSGRGVLIVPGTFGAADWFAWDGVVLAGALGDIETWGGRISGLLVGGLNAGQGSVEIEGLSIYYDSCNVLDAMASIAYLEPVESTWWQEF